MEVGLSAATSMHEFKMKALSIDQERLMAATTLDDL